jgi:sphingolipid delta-4 desaturase
MGKGGSSTAAVEAPAVRGAKGKLVARTDFFWDDNDEPHAARRKAIMKAHPEVSKLTGPEWRSKYICLFALVLPQIWLSVVTADLPWLPYLAIAYVFGATITQALFLAIHELAHNLFFKSPLHNRLFSMVANWPIGIPYTIPFRGYHLEHHKFQGVDGVDTDVPSYFEAQHIRGPLSKTAWACCQILTYALRPMFIKAQDITAMHVTNWAVQIAFDAAMLYAFGWRPLAYMVLCILLAGGLHPCAGHFISEHYVFPHLAPKQETYSYYGPLNYLTWNVGYHNEHHDFPYIPWSRLPELRRIAPEFYDNLAVCESWVGVIWDYIMRDDVGPYNRVKRPMPKEE